MLHWLWTSYSRLVLDGIEDVVDGEPQRGEVLLHSEDSKWIWGENREHLLLEGGLPLILMAGMGWSSRCEFIFSSSLLSLRE